MINITFISYRCALFDYFQACIQTATNGHNNTFINNNLKGERTNENQTSGRTHTRDLHILLVIIYYTMSIHDNEFFECYVTWFTLIIKSELLKESKFLQTFMKTYKNSKY